MSLDIAQLLDIENKKDYKLHAARYNGASQPLDTFLTNRKEWGSWNSWRSDKNEFNRKYVVSFMKFYPESNTWLFGGIYEILGGGKEKRSHSYNSKLTDIGEELIGRLKIYANLTRGRSFKFENIYNKLSFCEVLKECYNGEIFCGYENISQDFSSLEVIYKNERTDWRTALENVKGIYTIVDKNTGKKYVGSAYGDTGIWARWASYMNNGHGWNKELIGLIKNAGLDYARKNFRITLIECLPFKTDDKVVIQRENFWKEALLTRDKRFGYNAN